MPGDLRAAERRLPGRAAIGIADLGGDLNLPTKASALGPKPLAERFFTRSAAIGVRGVEAPQPDLPCLIEQAQGLLFAIAGAAQGGRGADAAEIAAAEHDPVEVMLRQQFTASPRIANLLFSSRSNVRTRPIADIHRIVHDRCVRPSVIWRLATLSPAALVLAACTTAPSTSTCPEPATQADVLPYNARQFGQIRLTAALRQAVAKVQACRPAHPVLRGPALLRFQDARQAPDGRVLLRFSVDGLADMYLIYLADRQGRLLKAYVDAP